MKVGLTIKEKRFLEKYLQGKPLYECAKYAGSKSNDRASLTNIGYLTMRKLDISMEEILSLNGITDQRLAEKLNEGLDAKTRYRGTWRGDIVESDPFPDTSNRLKALELAARMRGLFIDKHELTGRDGGDIILQVSSGSKKGSKNIDID